jgi:arsenite/tail-anchored protein-transporting ATPase
VLLSRRPITFFGGKGGVGKTTVAAAAGLALAESGHRVLVVSTDPAHSLADAYETPLGERATLVADHLWAAEPDAERAVRRRVREVADEAAAAVPAEIMPAVERHLSHAASGPGMLESALADQLMDHMDQVPEHFDRLVVDSAPTGHLLRMLALPTLLTPWIRGLARQRERAAGADRLLAAGVADAPGGDDPLLERLHTRRRKIERCARRLREEAEVRLVLLARRMVLAETERAAQQLSEGGFTLGPVVINQIPAEPDREVLDAARRRIAAHGVTGLPLLAEEPTGLEPLRAIPGLVKEA